MPTVVFKDDQILDTRIGSGWATIRHGIGNVIIVGDNSSTSSAQRSFVGIDQEELSQAIPQGSSITDVRVRLYMSYRDSTCVGFPMYLRRVLKPIVVTEATWVEYADGQAWSEVGCSASSDRNDEASAHQVVGDTGWHEWFGNSLVSDVQLWLAGILDNNGWLIEAPDLEFVPDVIRRVYFYASWYGEDVELRPEIEVEYEEPPTSPIYACTNGAMDLTSPDFDSKHHAYARDANDRYWRLTINRDVSDFPWQEGLELRGSVPDASDYLWEDYPNEADAQEDLRLQIVHNEIQVIRISDGEVLHKVVNAQIDQAGVWHYDPGKASCGIEGTFGEQTVDEGEHLVDPVLGQIFAVGAGGAVLDTLRTLAKFTITGEDPALYLELDVRRFFSTTNKLGPLLGHSTLMFTTMGEQDTYATRTFDVIDYDTGHSGVYLPPGLYVMSLFISGGEGTVTVASADDDVYEYGSAWTADSYIAGTEVSLLEDDDLVFELEGLLPFGFLCMDFDITLHPQDLVVDEGDTAVFTVEADVEADGFQWQRDVGVGWRDLVGETDSTLTIEKTKLELNQSRYRCIVTYYEVSKISETAVLTVLREFDWTASRKGVFRYFRVDYKTRLEKEELTTVKQGGSITRNMYTSLKESGVVPIVEPPVFGDDLIRIYYEMEDEHGTKESIVLATMHAAVERVQTSAATKTCDVILYSALLTLQQDVIETSLTIDAGTVAVDEAKAICEAQGLPVIMAGESTKELGVDASFDAGTSYLTIVNHLLGYANFWSAQVDVWGRVLFLPYRPPESRALDWTFVDGEGCVFLPEMELDSDVFDVPNKCVLTSSNPEHTFSGSYTNDDPDSPYSTVSRGRVIAITDMVNDAESEEDLNARAQAMLYRATAVSETAKLTHVYVPIAVASAVELAWADRDIMLKGTVQSQEISLVPSALTVSDVKRIWE